MSPMSWSEAVSVVTGPGGMFEIADAEVGGQKLKVFKNAPPSLRALFGAARGRGDATFLVYEDERWSFADVMTRVDALGAALAGRYGIRPGDRVAIAMRNYPEWVIAFAAITSIGAISVSLNAWWTTEENEYALRDSGSRVVVADRERLERIAPLIGPLGLRVVAVRADGALPSAAERWDDVVVPGAALPEVAITPDTDATILYTSGTTGHPKGAVSVACPLTRRWGRTLSDEFKRGDGHAGRDETSLVLAAGDDVRASYKELPTLGVSLADGIREGKKTFVELGMSDAYTGAPSLATAEEGEELYDKLAEMVATEVREALASKDA